MIKFSSTVPAKEIAGTLFKKGIDRIIVGNNDFGLRLPTDYDIDEIAEITKIAHSQEKEVIVAGNAILHNEKLSDYRKYLADLNGIGVDYVMVGDAGAVNIIQNHFPKLKFIYNGEVLDTNSGMINFWGDEGASFVQVAREVPRVELMDLLPKLRVEPILQLFGPIPIEHSARSLIYNYLDYEDKAEEFNYNQIYHVTLPKQPDQVYTMFEDQNGTHMYAPTDLNLIEQFGELVDLGISNFMFDSKFYKPDNWLKIIEIFDKARSSLTQGKPEDIVNWTEELNNNLPVDRNFSTGFYSYQSGDIK